MISGMRSALLAASLLLPAAAPALGAPQEGGHYVWVPPGSTVVLVRAAPAPVDFPVGRMIAQQDAMIQRMMADMDALMAMPMPSPDQMIRSVMSGMPQVGAGSGVVVTSITTGNGTCTQTITYGPQTNGQPVVKTSSTGNACGTVQPSGPIGVTQKPSVARPKERLWNVQYPARPIAPPRT